MLANDESVFFTWRDFSWEDARECLITFERAQRKGYTLDQLGEPMRLSRYVKNLANTKKDASQNAYRLVHSQSSTS